MSTLANSEQKLAIEHEGGVLLSAGAGSGKTFVLKEHLIYLCRSWIANFNPSEGIEFNHYVKDKLRSIVMMTFTNKAAGELEIRIKNEFQEILEASDGHEKRYWESIFVNLDYLTISTIHGFCLKLIRQNFFPEISADQTIVSESEFKKCLDDLFNDWLILNEKKTSKLEFQIILKNKKKVLEAIIKIFSDASLRKLWCYEDTSKIKEELVNDDLNSLFCALNFDEIFDGRSIVSMFEEFKGKKWADFMVSFLNEINVSRFDLKSVNELYKYFLNLDFKIPAKPSAKGVSDELKEFYVKVKELKDFLKKNGESFNAFFSEMNGAVSSWYEQLYNLVQYIEENYYKLEGITFADLEYLVIKSLNPSIIDKIAKEYNYFIIDEFQDTSFIQFEIVEKIIKSDYSKLFCVGDPKQAIYGFRGGEIGVFLNCQKNIPKNLSLKNNYRSTETIINYNNKLFDFLFELGPGFEGREKTPVAVEYQSFPGTKDCDGEVIGIRPRCKIAFEEDKLSNFMVDTLEACAIVEKVKELKSKNEKCAVLYKRLKPSMLLIDLMIKNDIGFTAQVKIPFLDDPINGIFFELVSFLRNTSGSAKDNLVYVINGYLSLLGSDLGGLVGDDLIDKFLEDIKFFGLTYASVKFFNALNIYNSNYKANISAIISMINNSNSNIDELLLILEEQKEYSYSLDFQFGQNPNDIILMSAHASKGLQFENVILGGIYTNDVTIPNSGPVGSYPFSFKWSSNISGKKFYKTPAYLLEEFERKKKEFSESKRLFYVANTRAEKSLYFISLDFDYFPKMKMQSGSWFRGLDLFKYTHSKIEKYEDIEIEDPFNSGDQKKSKVRTPFFHIDDLGVSIQKNKDQLLLMPELSVTRLSSIAQCPRKFYLENICKIGEEDLEQIPLKKEAQLEIFLDEDNAPKSDKDRGTRLHYEISQAIESGFSRKVNKEILWAVEKLREKVENFSFISEKQIKFKLFDYMISGIPDLVAIGKEDMALEIWDFKTGAYAEQKLPPYTFQLMCYSYAYYELGLYSKNKQTKLVYCFVDENKIVEKTVSFKDVENYLIEKISMVNSPKLVNLDHCDSCLYSPVCHE